MRERGRERQKGGLVCLLSTHLNNGSLSEACLGTDLGWSGSELRGGGKRRESLHSFYQWPCGLRTRLPVVLTEVACKSLGEEGGGGGGWRE